MTATPPETTPLDLVRLLINDPAGTNELFADTDITAFLQLEGGSVKRAAAQAIDTIADNEVLVAKVIRTQAGISTDGARVADALRKRAAVLREQALEDDEDAGFFELIPQQPASVELADRPWWP
ncbi:MAG: hypothetical protein HOV66_28060 [Streptomycetaceae bacterium]|nr:hypothetical protein [Streptomycetaceae bacterium]